MSQVTWSALETMYRMYKYYDMPLIRSTALHQEEYSLPRPLSFLASFLAEFKWCRHILLVFRVVMIFTSPVQNWVFKKQQLVLALDSVLWLGVYNSDLKKYITPQVVMQWARNMIANRLAKYMNLTLLDGLVRERNGRISTSATILVSSFLFIHWIGTYNNEWMVIDYKLIQDVSVFTKNDKNEYQFLPGTFTLLEQIPGSTHEEDLTEYIFRRRASLRLVFWTKKDSSPPIIFLTLRISTILLATLNVLPNIYLLSWWMAREFPLFQSTATIILMRKHRVLKSLLETLLTFKTTKIWDSWWCTTITLMMSSPSATALLAILPLWRLPAEAIWMIPMVFLLLWSWWF